MSQLFIDLYICHYYNVNVIILCLSHKYSVVNCNWIIQQVIITIITTKAILLTHIKLCLRRIWIHLRVDR